MSAVTALTTAAQVRTILKDSPSMETFVLEFELAAASTSAKWAESFAERPKAVRASVTISEVVPRSSPDP